MSLAIKIFQVIVSETLSFSLSYSLSQPAYSFIIAAAPCSEIICFSDQNQVSPSGCSRLKGALALWGGKSNRA